MDDPTRRALERATQAARGLLEKDFRSQLEGTFDVLPDGHVAERGGPHLSAKQHLQRAKVVAAIEHKRAAGMKPAEAVADYLRDAAFTTLNRFAALKMLEARGLVLESVSKGDESAGYKEYCGLAPGLALLPDGAGYRLYVESVFDELSTEVKVLFDRHDAASMLWPKRSAFEDLLAELNATSLAGVWAQDETIGWVYQYFNSGDERKKMRDPKQGGSQAPRNSRELAVRNQFFTPRYVVQFLTDNTLGRTWIEMHGEGSALWAKCEYLVRSEEGFRARVRKDPREIRVLDPACGSGHFLLYAFDLLLVIYEEAWASFEKADQQGSGEAGKEEPIPRLPASPLSSPSEGEPLSLRERYPTLEALRLALPGLILEHNLYGVDIDPRAAQIAALALWLRAQRAYGDFGIARADRPPIQRTHIVVAEPMPGDESLVEEFASALSPPLLRDLFKKMIGEMRLAGELGVLLRVEDAIAGEIARAREQFLAQQKVTGFLPGLEPVKKQGELDLSGIDDDAFFHEAESRILRALEQFAESAAGAAGVRRRLFAGDAEQGIALIDVVRTRFDVVLMNPPFGLPIAADVVQFQIELPANLYAWFLARGAELLVPDGLSAAITDSTWLKQPTFLGLRRFLLGKQGLAVVADLGWGVLDANVRTCLQVSRKGSNATFQIVDATSADTRLAVLRDPASYAARSLVDTDGLPKAIVSTGYGPTEAALLQHHGTLGDVAELPWGCGANDSFRLFRLRWELPAAHSGDWCPMTNGGAFSPFYRENSLFCRVAFSNESAFDVSDGDGEKLWDASARQFIGATGLTYPKRSEFFHTSALPPGLVVTPEGKGLFPIDLDAMPVSVACGLTNSSLVGLMASFLCGPHKQRGDVSLIPCPRLTKEGANEVARAAQIAAEAILLLYRSRETSLVFVSPAETSHGVDAVRRMVVSQRGIIDRVVESVVPSGLIPSIREFGGEIDLQIGNAWEVEVTQEEAWLSYGIGCAFGRFDIRVSTGERPVPPCPDPFGSPPGTPPGLLAADVGLPSESVRVDYPLDLSAYLLVDDEGHRYDFAEAVETVFEVVFRDDAHVRWRAATDAVEPGSRSIRNWLSRSFFQLHLDMYSKSRRKAPIYWQLGVPSGRYSVWLYAHRATRDTLYAVQDLVKDKLLHEERALADAVQSAGPHPTAGQRKDLEAKETLVEELRAFREEVARVAPLWRPDLDDGVVLTKAPLWRLVPQHRAWQRELKSYWDGLCQGKYDWAHVAMHLWPERVVPKCAQDRSLAIAHDLEDVFWVEGDKGKWAQRKEPTRPLEELIEERTSPAVKSALASLMAAPAVTVAPTKRGRKAKKNA